MKRVGRIWKFGDSIDTDVMAPGKYLSLDIKELVPHTLEAVDPRFASDVRPGDLVLAGRNFGCGSSREQAPRLLKLLGVGAVLAVSFARIFARNCTAIGLPSLGVPAAFWTETEAGDEVEVDFVAGVLVNRRSGRTFSTPPVRRR